MVIKKLKITIIVSSIILYIIIAFGTYGYTKVVRQKDTEYSTVTGFFWPIVGAWIVLMKTLETGADFSEWIFTPSQPIKVEK